MKLTKTFLNKFIIWSSSRYNEWKKKDVIRHILDGFKEGRIGKKHYSSGSYCPCSTMTGLFDYIVDYDNKEIIKCYCDDNMNITKEFERVKIDEIK